MEAGEVIAIFNLKIYIKQLGFFFFFLSSKPWIRIGSRSVFNLKCWIQIHIKWIRIQNTGKKTAKKYATPELTRYLTGLMPPPTPHTLSSLTIPCFMLSSVSARHSAFFASASSTWPWSKDDIQKSLSSPPRPQCDPEAKTIFKNSFLCLRVLNVTLKQRRYLKTAFFASASSTWPWTKDDIWKQLSSPPRPQQDPEPKTIDI